MFSFLIAISLLVSQQHHTYQSHNAVYLEAPNYVLCAECPQPTPKVLLPPKKKELPAKKPIHLAFATPAQQLQELIDKSKAVQETMVHFTLDSAVLSPSEKTSLDLLDKTINYDVIGYTCDIGSKKHNEVLALKRARAVADYLSLVGIKDLAFSGKGKCCYLDTEDKAKNRRVEVKGKVVIKGEGNAK